MATEAPFADQEYLDRYQRAQALMERDGLDARAHFKLIEGDVTRVGQHNGFMEGVDAVIHLAALSNDPLGCLSDSRTLEINHRASVQLAEAAKAADLKTEAA